MMNGVGVIGPNITVFPSKTICKLFHQGAIFKTLGRRQVSGQIYVLWMGWTPYIMFMNNRLIFFFFCMLIRYIIMVKKLL